MSDVEMSDADKGIDRDVSSSIDDALTAVNAAVEAQQHDPGNQTDPNDMAVMSGLLQVQSELQSVAQSQAADIASWSDDAGD
jgi:hypothetical protein